MSHHVLIYVTEKQTGGGGYPPLHVLKNKKWREKYIINSTVNVTVLHTS